VASGQPRFSIIIPVKQVNDYVHQTVTVLKALNFLDWELFIVSNEKENYSWGDTRISLLDSGRVSPAIKRNLGVGASRGEIIVFIDDDSYPNPDFFQRLNQVFEDKDVNCVGGPAITPKENGFRQRASGAVYESLFLGGNPIRYRAIDPPRLVDDWPSVNLSIRKSKFLDVGGFDSQYWPGEDTAFCATLKAADISINYQPEIKVWHHRRSGLLTHLKQAGGYGLHRGYFARHLPSNSRRIQYFFPSVLLVTLLSIMGLVTMFPQRGSLALSLLIPYVIALFLGFMDTLRRGGIALALYAVVLALVTHLFYGYMFIRGFFRRSPLVSRLR
jgi:glycosyltransferase involved in cell wall biosynthesis